MRKSIFEILNEKNDYSADLKRITTLYDKIRIRYETTYEPVDIFITKAVFPTWKKRQKYISVKDMRSELLIDDLLKIKKMSVDCLLVCVEFYFNLVALISQNKDLKVDDFSNFDYFKMLGENLKILAEDLNHQFIYSESDETGILIEKNPSATAVAEIIEDELSFETLRYNHYLLKGNLEEKRTILRKLANTIEPEGKILKQIDNEIGNNLFYLLNNFSIRHNNSDPTDVGKFNPLLPKMSNEELEYLYDETYQLELLGFLLLKYREKSQQFTDLKNKISDMKAKIKENPHD